MDLLADMSVQAKDIGIAGYFQFKPIVFDTGLVARDIRYFFPAHVFHGAIRSNDGSRTSKKCVTAVPGVT